jgi:hypothetical protein
MQMRKVLTGLFMASLTILSISFYQSAFSKEDGSPSGNTNSPGDGRTCARDSCHTGEAKPKDGILSINVPAAGYNAADTYTVTVSIDFPGRSTFGFQVSPQTIDGDLLGEIIVTDDFQTKTTSAGKFITHEKEGIDGSDGKTWTFDWTSADATGDVTFYYAINAADGDGEATGDSIFYGSLTITEDPANIPLTLEQLNSSSPFTVQNPVFQQLHILCELAEVHYSVRLIDLKGSLAFTSGKTYSGNATIHLPAVAAGVYFLEIFDGTQYYFSRIVKGA